MIGLQVKKSSRFDILQNLSVFELQDEPCCDTLLFLAMLQCSSHQHLTDSPGINNILLHIHDSIGILDVVGQ